MLPARRAMLLRKKQEEVRERDVECAREREDCRINNCWLKTSEARNVAHTVRRDTDDVMMQHRCSVHQRQQRLRELLDEEERQLVLAARRAEVTPQERQKQMRERAKSLHDAREALRKQVVAQKLDQQFRLQCQELREAQSKRQLLQICEERTAQLRNQQEGGRARKREDDMFHQLWQADARAKEERERREAVEARRCGQMQMEFLCQQMAEIERLKQSERLARLEEARQQEEKLLLLQQQAQRQRRLEQDRQTARRHMLDETMRLKTERVAKEHQEELQRELSIVRQKLQEECQAQQELADKRAEMRNQHLRFHQYLAEHTLKCQEDEERMEQLMDAHLKEEWDRRARLNQLQQDARDRLMDEVTESRRLQTQQKQARDVERRADVAKERSEMDAAARDVKRADEEVSKRRREAHVAYQVELLEQMEQRRLQRRQEEQEEEREQARLRKMEQDKLDKKDQVLARPHDGVLHPFRKAAQH